MSSQRISEMQGYLKKKEILFSFTTRQGDKIKIRIFHQQPNLIISSQHKTFNSTFKKQKSQFSTNPRRKAPKDPCNVPFSFSRLTFSFLLFFSTCLLSAVFFFSLGSLFHAAENKEIILITKKRSKQGNRCHSEAKEGKPKQRNKK